MKTDLLQPCGQNWVFRICWHTECSTLTTSSFRILNSSAIPLHLELIRISPQKSHQFSSVQSLSHVQLFVTPWAAAPEASLSNTNSRSPPKPVSIESVLPSSHLILCRPLLLLPSILPSIRVFSNESVLTSGWQSIGASSSASVLPINIQDWFPLGLTGLISLLSKGLSRVFSCTTVQKHQFFSAPLSLWSKFSHPYMTTGKTIGGLLLVK